MTHLGAIAARVNEMQSKMWRLFFLVVTGRALEADDLAPDEYEQVFAGIYDLSKSMPFDIKTTEAMHYRRYASQRRKAEGITDQSKPGSAAWRSAGVSDGKGFVFVSHTGDINPSGFLPVKAGNIRTDSLTGIYRNSTLFRSLRDTSLREGRCGVCEYKNLCGGSRARASLFLKFSFLTLTFVSIGAIAFLATSNKGMTLR
jgi:radical SAM protein with 4Fe4S-binding SPASM domain